MSSVRRRSRRQEPLSLTDPIRTCIGCRRTAGQSALVRFVADGRRLAWGAGRPGRGAWLCRDSLAACFDAAVAGRRWSRALRANVDNESLAAIRSELIPRARR